MANRKTAKKKARLERKRLEALGLPIQSAINFQQAMNIKEVQQNHKVVLCRQNADNKPTICKMAEEKPWNLDDEIDKAFERRLGK